MREWQSQFHAKHYCSYHIVSVPKYLEQMIYGMLRKEICPNSSDNIPNKKIPCGHHNAK